MRNRYINHIRVLLTFRALAHAALALSLVFLSNGCKVETTNTNTNLSTRPSPSPVSSPAKASTEGQITLPLLEALLQNETFTNQLSSKLQLSDAQIAQLKQAAGDELARLRQQNAEESGGNAAEARARASEQIVKILGEAKATELVAFAMEFWAKGGDESSGTGKEESTSKAPIPNAVPTDTRIVVNIPAYRMDLFRDGSLVKSYKIGIGYPEFPLPQGLRKAQTIIFNPTWTPPDSPWVANMKNVTPGEKIEAGSKLNPLGPVKIPIGMPSLIHGGKSPAKLGQFASHGCVGLTNSQVKDFAKLLAEASGASISDRDLAAYFQDKTRTRVVKLGQTVPVELRYETIVVEDGKLHIYRDVYDQGTNSEENLRVVLEANGSHFEDFSEDERKQVMTALNEMSAHPKPTVAPSQMGDNSKSARQKDKAAAAKKKQKEVVIEMSSLNRGYPAPVDLDTGTGKPAAKVARSE